MIYFAPLHGITLYPFRNCFMRYFEGVDYFVTPFLAAANDPKPSPRIYRDVWPSYNDNSKIIPQILGQDKAALIQSCYHLKSLGYHRVNWNLGCPSKQVVRHGRGCALIKNSEMIADILDAILKIEDFKFSIKIRLGQNDIHESEELIQRIQNYPLDFMAIHPRLGSDEYRGQPNIDAFKHLIATSTQRVMYNGDIFTVSDFNERQQQFSQIDQWMIGRGLLRNPFLAEEIKQIPSKNKAQRFAEFLQAYQDELLNGILSENGVLSHFKELWRYFAYRFQISPEAMRELLQTQTLKAFNLKIQKFL